MSPTLIATIAGLTTAFCWGFGDWLSAKGTKKFDPFVINFGVSCVNIILVTGLLLFAHITMPTHEQLLAIITAGTLITTAYLIFVKALTSGPVGIIVPLGNTYPLITIALSVVLLSQVFNAAQVGAMVGIVLGATLLAYQKNRQQIPLRELHKDTLLAVIAAIIWGFGFFVLNSVVDQVSWQTIAVFMEIAMFIVGLSALTFVHRSKTLKAMKQAVSSKIVMLAGVAGTSGFVAFYVGSDYAGSAVIPTVLSGCGPLVAAFLGAVFDHEKLGVIKRLGAVLVVIGIIVLNLA